MTAGRARSEQVGIAPRRAATREWCHIRGRSRGLGGGGGEAERAEGDHREGLIVMASVEVGGAVIGEICRVFKSAGKGSSRVYCCC
jgi:hypothetical protein